MDYPGYADPHVDMPVDDEDMPPPNLAENSAPEPDLNDYLVVTEMKTWICRTIRMKMVDIRQEAVRRDRDLAMGRFRTGQLALPMEYHEESPLSGGPPDAPGAPPQ
eukprot:s13192_g1.t1